MTDIAKKQFLKKLFEDWSGEKLRNILLLPRSGSYREYYRLTGKTKTAMGVFNLDHKENIAFLSFTKHFYRKGRAVPEIYSEDLEQYIYLQEDLGDTTLFQYLIENRKEDDFPDLLLPVYQKVIEELPKFQITASKDLDYSVSYPRPAFDKQSMMWDMSYFKYYFLKLAQIPFDEQDLENDFHTLSEYLLSFDDDYFLYRDFQSRNIMLNNDKPYFIDYQGGRKGALQYDIASLLYDSKANIPNSIRTHFLEHYIASVQSIVRIDKEEFLKGYYAFALIRIMQAMGAYGFRGFYEKKEHFLDSIPYAIGNLNSVLEHINIPIPSLIDTLNRLLDSEKLKQFNRKAYKLVPLEVYIKSFAFSSSESTMAINEGYLFDCRALHDPSHYKEYQSLTGKDKEVSEFFAQESQMESYLENVFALVELSVNKAEDNSHKEIHVAFGSDQGKYRSVYCAEKLAHRLKEKHKLRVIVSHKDV